MQKMIPVLDWLIEKSVLLTIFALPLVFWPSLYTTFEVAKIVFFKGLLLVICGLWILRWGVARATGSVFSDAEDLRSGGGNRWSYLFPVVRATGLGSSGAAWPSIFLGLLILSWVLSTVFSSAPLTSIYGIYPRFQGVLSLLAYVIFGLIVFLELRRGAGFLQKILGAIFASTFFVCAFVLLQRFGFSWLNFWDTSAFLGRAFGTMAHPDFLAGLLVMVIPLLIAKLMSLHGKVLPFSKIHKQLVEYLWTGFCVLTLILALTTLYFTLSRSAFLGLFVAMLIFILFYLKQSGGHAADGNRLKQIEKSKPVAGIKAQSAGGKKLTWFVLILPLIAFVLIIACNLFRYSPFVQNNILLNRMVVSGENLRSVETRFALWPATIKLIAQRPLFGYGADNFALSFPAFAPVELNTLENLGDYPDRAHNFLLDYTAQFGLLGLTVFCIFLVWIFKRSFKLLNQLSKAADPEFFIILGFTVGLIGVLVANLFGFFVTVQWVYFALYLAIILSHICSNMFAGNVSGKEKDLSSMQRLVPSAAERNVCREDKSFFLPRHAMKNIIFVIFIIQAVIFWNVDLTLFRSDLLYRDYINSPVTANIGLLLDAAKASPNYIFYAEQLVDSAVAKGTESDLKTSVTILKKQGAVNGLDGFYWLKIGMGLAKLKDFQNAFTAFEQAEKLMPNYPLTYLEYGKALLANELYTQALAQFKKYLQLCPPYYKWQKDMEDYAAGKIPAVAHTPEERERYRIFYKLNPNFNEVFRFMQQAKDALQAPNPVT